MTLFMCGCDFESNQGQKWVYIVWRTLYVYYISRRVPSYSFNGVLLGSKLLGINEHNMRENFK
jgi:hypothetical protein